MKRFVATMVTLLMSLTLFGPAQAAADDDEAGGFVLTPFYGASFLKADRRSWTEERLGGSVVQGLALGKRLGDHVLAEVGLAIAPGRSLEERHVVYPLEYESETSSCAVAVDSSGTPASGCLIPPYAELDTLRVVSYEYGASLAVDLGGRDTRPFLSAGLGAVTYAFDHGTNTNLRMSFGAGVRRTLGRLARRVWRSSTSSHPTPSSREGSSTTCRSARACR